MTVNTYRLMARVKTMRISSLTRHSLWVKAFAQRSTTNYTTNGKTAHQLNKRLSLYSSCWINSDVQEATAGRKSGDWGIVFTWGVEAGDMSLSSTSCALSLTGSLLSPRRSIQAGRTAKHTMSCQHLYCQNRLTLVMNALSKNSQIRYYQATITIL